MGLGQKKILQFKNPLRRLHITRNILKVKESPRRITLIAKELGFTELQLNTNTYSIYIVEQPLLKVWTELKEFVITHPDLKLEYQFGTLKLNGTWIKTSDYLKFWNWNSSLASPLIFEGRLHPQEFEKFKSEFQKRWGHLPFQLHIEGLSPYIKLRSGEKLSRQMKATGLKLHSSRLSKSLGHILVLFTQKTKSQDKQRGADWNGGFLNFDLFTGRLESLKIRAGGLKAQHNLGQFKTLKMALFQNEKSHFESGGDYPISQSHRWQQKVSWKKFGLQIEAHAEVLGTQSLSLDFNLSLGVASPASGAVPIFLKDSFKSKIHLQPNEWAPALSFQKNLESISSEGLPILAQIPFLKEFFSKKNKSQDAKDLHVFLKWEQESSKL